MTIHKNELKDIELRLDKHGNALTNHITDGEAYNLIKQYNSDQKLIDEHDTKVSKLLSISCAVAFINFVLYFAIIIGSIWLLDNMILAVISCIIGIGLVSYLGKIPDKQILKLQKQLLTELNADITYEQATSIHGVDWTRKYIIDHQTYVLIGLATVMDKELKNSLNDKNYNFDISYADLDLRNLNGQPITVAISDSMCKLLSLHEDVDDSLIILTEAEYEYLID